MMRAVWGAVALSGAILFIAATGKEDLRSHLAVARARKEKPYPFPVAYRFGFAYREESLREDAWQTRFYARHLAGTPAGDALRLHRPALQNRP